MFRGDDKLRWVKRRRDHDSRRHDEKLKMDRTIDESIKVL